MIEMIERGEGGDDREGVGVRIERGEDREEGRG